jgi:hypothetical protein
LPLPPNRFVPGVRVRSSAVEAVPKSNVTGFGPVLRSACRLPVSVRASIPTSGSRAACSQSVV